jgi:hypothetical protein
MIVGMTSKNRIRIPEEIVDQIGDVRHFEVDLHDGLILLKPLRSYGTSLTKIRSKIKDLDVGPEKVAEAVRWARTKPSRS